MVEHQEEEPEVEYVEGYEMEEEDDDDAMEDFGKGATRMSDSEDGEFFFNSFFLRLVSFSSDYFNRTFINKFFTSCVF